MSHALVNISECRAQVWHRCAGRCELCGQPLQAAGWEAHHRLLRSQGGPWCPCNIVALHPRCHTQGRWAVHDNPERSYASGHMVASHDDPRELHLDLPPGFRFDTALLTCGGTYT